jgi:protein CpxP
MNDLLRGTTSLLLAVAVMCVPLGAEAQLTPRSRGGQMREGERRSDARDQLDKRLEERINLVIRERLRLSDDQFTRLRAVARRVETERRALRMEEGSTRGTLRRELLAGDSANDSTVAIMLDRLPSIERKRIDLMEREQGELAKFLTPVQRAKYVGLQDELRRSMQDLQFRRSDGLPQGGDSSRRGNLPRRPFRPPV